MTDRKGGGEGGEPGTGKGPGKHRTRGTPKPRPSCGEQDQGNVIQLRPGTPIANTRHERFAQGIADGLSARHAYENAGYKRDDGNASRLQATDKVRRRVAELAGLRAAAAAKAAVRAAEEAGVDRGWVTARLKDNALAALAAGPAGYAAANRALELLGKDVGMFRDQLDLTQRDATDVEIDRMTPEERKVEARRLMRELGLDPTGTGGLDG